MADAPMHIDRDTRCPRCRYNLRGRTGDAVMCPECGERWDARLLLGRMQAAGWTPRLTGDVVFVTIITGEVLILAPLLALTIGWAQRPVAAALLIGGIVMIWLLACHAFCCAQRSYRRGLSLLAHALLGLAMISGGILLLVMTWMNQEFWPQGVVACCAAAGTISMITGLMTVRRARWHNRLDELRPHPNASP